MAGPSTQQQPNSSVEAEAKTAAGLMAQGACRRPAKPQYVYRLD
jgi:hypothetical protein